MARRSGRPGPSSVVLADELVEGPRPHALGERRADVSTARPRSCSGSVEQRHVHARLLRRFVEDEGRGDRDVERLDRRRIGIVRRCVGCGNERPGRPAPSPPSTMATGPVKVERGQRRAVARHRRDDRHAALAKPRQGRAASTAAVATGSAERAAHGAAQRLPAERIGCSVRGDDAGRAAAFRCANDGADVACVLDALQDQR